jgi:hypothetical protein
MRFDKTIKTVAELVRSLKPLQDRSTPIWFRGCTNSGYQLLPSIVRRPFTLKHEPTLVTEFKQDALQFATRPPTTEWEWLFLMRHHGVPTRLLDWTENPLIGLYFAVNSVDQSRRSDKNEGVLWVLFPTRLNEQANVKFDVATTIPIFDEEDEYLANYLPSKLAKEQHTSLNPLAGIAMRQSLRMQAQHSVFTVTHRNLVPIEEVGDGRNKGKHIGRFVVPASSKPLLRKELEALKITRLTVFPELDNVGDKVQGRYRG